MIGHVLMIDRSPARAAGTESRLSSSSSVLTRLSHRDSATDGLGRFASLDRRIPGVRIRLSLVEHRPGPGNVRRRPRVDRSRLLEKRREGLGDFSGRLRSPRRLLGHHPGDNGGQLGGHLGPDEVERLGVLRDVGLANAVKATSAMNGGRPVNK